MKKLSKKQMMKSYKTKLMLVNHSNNPTDDYVYHITSPTCWKRIVVSGGLLGGSMTMDQIRREKTGTQTGFLYFVDSPNKKEWDLIPHYCFWGEDHPFSPSTKTDEYVVLGVRKDWLAQEGERYYKTVRPLVYCLEWRRDVDEFVEDKFEEVEKFIQDLHTEWYKEKKGDGNPSIRTMEIIKIPQPKFN